MKLKPGQPCPHDFLYLDKEFHYITWKDAGHIDEVCIDCLSRSCEIDFTKLEVSPNAKAS